MANFKKSNFKKEKSEFDSRNLGVDRVTRVVAGGKRFRFRVIVVVGDHKGRVGIGMGKGIDVSMAIEKATNQGKKHLVNVPIIADGTIPHAIHVKF
ncbi:MAG: 30S ribosomal protein S5, partial [Candidatus Portnoybacteria bacterium CG10_big_fil_rev_8_21_14_0_10_36_7]